MKFEVGTVFIGNVNKVIFKVIDINKEYIVFKDQNNKVYEHTLSYLQHLDITIL